MSKGKKIADKFYACIEGGDIDTVEREIYHPNAKIWHCTDEIDQSVAENAASLRGMLASVEELRFDREAPRDFDGGFALKFTLNAKMKSGAKLRVPVLGMFYTDSEDRIVRLEEYHDSAPLKALAETGAVEQLKSK